MTSLIIIVFILFFSLEWIVESSLDLLNVKHIKQHSGEIPAAFKEVINADEQEKSECYTLAKSHFGVVQKFFDKLITLALLFSGILPWLDQFIAGRGVTGLTKGVLFFIIISFTSSLFGLPFTLYFNFVLEKKFGFNKMTFSLWLSDLIKGTVLSLLIGIPALYALFWFMNASGSLWWLWASGFLVGLQFILMLIYPTLIAPLFNKFSPLDDQKLSNDIKSLADQIGFQLNGLLTMDGSKRSGHSNAYFTGFGKNKRIVLFDTLLKKVSHDEALSIIGHEMGHYKLKHIHKMLVVGIFSILAGFYILDLLLYWEPLYQAFGFSEPSYYIGLLLFTLCSGSFTFYFSPLMAALSRKHEFEADYFSVVEVKKPAAMKSALISLNKENLSNLHPHPWYSAWHYSHPTVVERIEAIDSI